MSLFGKVKAMFGLKEKTPCTKSAVDPAISRAIQRNEIASERAQAALEDLKMSDTMRNIAGRMK